MSFSGDNESYSIRAILITNENIYLKICTPIYRIHNNFDKFDFLRVRGEAGVWCTFDWNEMKWNELDLFIIHSFICFDFNLITYDFRNVVNERTNEKL